MDYMFNYLPELESLNLVATSILVGLIWVIQLIVYPSFQFIDQAKWQSFHQMHTRKISYLVAWLMPLELILALIVLAQYGFNLLSVLILVCLGVIWSSTFLVQVPAHNKLAKSSSVKEIQFLIKSNWIRTIAWTLKLGLLMYVS